MPPLPLHHPFILSSVVQHDTLASWWVGGVSLKSRWLLGQGVRGTSEQKKREKCVRVCVSVRVIPRLRTDERIKNQTNRGLGIVLVAWLGLAWLSHLTVAKSPCAPLGLSWLGMASLPSWVRSCPGRNDLPESSFPDSVRSLVRWSMIPPFRSPQVLASRPRGIPPLLYTIGCRDLPYLLHPLSSPPIVITITLL